MGKITRFFLHFPRWRKGDTSTRQCHGRVIVDMEAWLEADT